MNNYLVAAYAVLWIILLVYVFFLGRRYQQVSEQLQQLRHQVEQSKK